MSSPQIPQSPDAGQPTNVLRILSGLHAGASRTLAEQEMILVGSGDDCDIVLADQGVARHHALINLIGGMSSLRALDAPLRVDGQPLHPGDPVELRGLQRIQVGDAAIAYGEEHDPGWAALLPTAAEKLGMARAVNPGLRRLPMIAALAVLSLASLAIFAAVMPAHEKPVDVRAQLKSIINQYQVADGKILENVNGAPVLSGTVKDAAARARIKSRLDHDHIVADLDLRSGEDIAADVSEVLRTQHVNAKTRYLGNGVVEASGRFEDMEALRVAARSRAMGDVPGVRKVLANNYAEPGAVRTAANDPTRAPTPVAQAPLRIVSVVRSKEPHLVAVDGTEYPVGVDVPGHGKLVSIGEFVQVISSDGMLHKIIPEPVTAAEIAAAAAQKVAADASAAAAQAQPAANVDASGPATPDHRVAKAQTGSQDMQ
jgi:type III secretion system (T3SS) inner membrane Yop/YscD-like protein